MGERARRRRSRPPASAPSSPIGYVFASPLVPVLEPVTAYAAASFPPARGILAGAVDLMHRIRTEFKYDPEGHRDLDAAQGSVRKAPRRLPGFCPCDDRGPARPRPAGGLCQRLSAHHPAAGQAAPAGRRRDPCLGLAVVRRRAGLDRLRSDQRHPGRERSHHARGRARFLRRLAGRRHHRRLAQAEARRSRSMCCWWNDRSSRSAAEFLRRHHSRRRRRRPDVRRRRRPARPLGAGARTGAPSGREDPHLRRRALQFHQSAHHPGEFPVRQSAVLPLGARAAIPSTISSRWSRATASPGTRRRAGNCSATARRGRSSTCCWRNAARPARNCGWACASRRSRRTRMALRSSTDQGEFRAQVAGGRDRRSVDPENGIERLRLQDRRAVRPEDRAAARGAGAADLRCRRCWRSSAISSGVAVERSWVAARPVSTRRCCSPIAG